MWRHLVQFFRCGMFTSHISLLSTALVGRVRPLSRDAAASPRDRDLP